MLGGLRWLRRHLGRLRPPALVGVAIGIALIGLIIWLETSGGDETGEGAGKVVVPIARDTPPGHEAPDHGAKDAAQGQVEAPADHHADAAPRPESSAAEGAPSEAHHEPAPAEASHAVPAQEPEAAHAATETTSGESHEKLTEAAHEGADAHDGGDSTAHAEPVVLAPVDSELLQASSRGGLPIIGPDGRKPWQVYARPVAHDEKQPRLAIVISGLGLNRAMTEAAIKLPPEVTLSFSPYAPELEALIAAARTAGHEVMLDLPMEPISYPADDPGPQTLLTTLTPPQNIERLELVMARASGYVGMLGVMGSRFTTAPDSLRPVLSVLSERGLLFVDDRSSAESLANEIATQLKLPHTSSRGFIDTEATRSAIDAVLSRLERDARSDQPSLAIGRPFPITLQRVETWSKTLVERGVVLVPASAVVSKTTKDPHVAGAAGGHDKPKDEPEAAGHGEATDKAKPAASDANSTHH